MSSALDYFLSGIFGGTNSLLGSMEGNINDSSVNSILSDVQSGKMTAEEAMSKIAIGGYKLTPEQESYLSSMISNQRTNEARDYETEMANTDFLRAAQQLGALGMSPYNVLQSGASATPNVSAASSPMLNNANQRLNRATSIANSLIGMAGRMASSGIYGSALSSVRSSASRAASMAAHSAPVVLNRSSSYDNMSEDEMDQLFEKFKNR